MFKKAILPLALVLASGVANAGVITNDTDILTSDDHAQLSEWLGADFDLTRIFAKGIDGTNATDWHTAVDGKGATFTVMEVFDNNTNESRIIGGYNDNSWYSSGTSGTSTEAFLFNLSDDLIFEKNNRYQSGYNATFNESLHAVKFGPGNDLYVMGNLTSGIANIGHTYGSMESYGTAEYREQFAGSYGNFTIGSYETFTLSTSTADFNASSAADVPVSFLLGGLGLLGLVGARRKNKA